MGRKHVLEEVLRSLASKKNCNITGANPITVRVTDTIFPDKKAIDIKYQEYLLGVNVDEATLLASKIGVDAANKHYYNEFASKNNKLFGAKDITRVVVKQPAYCVNIKDARELGNGSWGKIDFLVNHCGYTLMKS